MKELVQEALHPAIPSERDPARRPTLPTERVQARRPALPAERGQALSPTLPAERSLQRVLGPVVRRIRGQARRGGAPVAAPHLVAGDSKTEKPSGRGLLSLKKQSSSSGMQPITQQNPNTQQQQQQLFLK
ncbi:hypothetical protein TSAR_012702 [Trichomalopsis sarcophagae]|uniref:Uncharacterized protein n=1 Tax=Trichomalopsis sarcophagae TaxID=543379 RepID=A0A232ETJ6_9HYME|nr:hypothetical protein TSAR_012702 [Trichomalopsis sarcophagae]